MNVSEERSEQMMRAIDPKGPFERTPSLTSLLKRVCRNDPAVFDDACELVAQFMDVAAADAAAVSAPVVEEKPRVVDSGQLIAVILENGDLVVRHPFSRAPARSVCVSEYGARATSDALERWLEQPGAAPVYHGDRFELVSMEGNARG